MLVSQGDMSVFFSNGLVGSLTGLALILLFWPLLSWGISHCGCGSSSRHVLLVLGPGVRSARYLSPHATDGERFADLFRRLDGVPDAQRTARFVCALAVVEDGELRFETRGVVEGRIAHAPAGAGGFGYDPIFVFPPLGCTLADAGAAKDTVSHRAHAFGAFARWLRDLR